MSTDIITAPTPNYDLTIDARRAIDMDRQLRKIVKDALHEGKNGQGDYGIIPGTGNKPVLFKAGAEKLLRYYGFSSKYPEERMTIVDTDDKFTARVCCIIEHMRTGYVVAEGIGYASSRESKYRSRDAASVANTILKMAGKRALLDGTLRACCASGLFTQDIGDDEQVNDATPSQPNTVTPSPTNGNAKIRAKAEQTYRELTDKADALEVPAAMYDPAWPDVELMTRGKALRAAIGEKETQLAHLKSIQQEAPKEEDF